MKWLLGCSLLALLVLQSSSAQEPEKVPEEERIDHYEASFPATGGVPVKIKVTSGKFSAEGHKLNPEDGTMDGRPCYGVDGIPREGSDVINTFVVTFGKKVVTVPAGLWQDCFNPTLRSPAINAKLPDYGRAGSLEVFISLDRKKVCIAMDGFRSAAAPYRVVWMIEDDGSADRMIEAMEH